MAEEQKTEQVQETEQTTEVQPNITDSLVNALLNDTTVTIPNGQSKQEEEKKEAPKTEEKPEQKEEEEVFEESAYLDKNFGWKSKEEATNAIKELQDKAKGFEWKNDYSKQIAEILNEGETKEEELYNILHAKRQISKLSKAEITDTKVAAELVKFGIQNENKNLTQDEVDFLFNEKYSVPSKPQQRDDELDDDYNQRVSAWQTQVQNIERKMIIEAKMQQPKLSALQNELVLPTIQKESVQEQAKQLSQEEIDAIVAKQNAFIQSAQQEVNNFKGFSVQIKDKDVDYTVNYDLSQDEKKLVNAKIEMFVQTNYDANSLFFDRWVNADGTMNQTQLVKDYMRIVSGEKSEQKLVTDAVGKRMEAYIQSKKNVDVRTSNQQSTFQPNPNKTQQEAVTDAWLTM